MLFHDFKLREFFILLFPQGLDVIDRFSIFHGFKNLIESLLQRSWLTHGPQTFVLVAENDRVQNGL